MTEPPVRISGSAFCTVNSVARALRSKVASKFSSVILPSSSGSTRPEPATRMSSPPSSRQDGREQPVQIRADRDVAREGAHAVADQRFGLVQLALAAAHDEDMGSFIDEPLRGRQPDPAAAAGDHGDFASQSCHQLVLQFRVVWWTCLCGVPGAWNTRWLSPYSTCVSAARQAMRRNVVVRGHCTFGCQARIGKASPNIGSPLLDSSAVASNCSTSQCSANTPSSRRTMSTAIQLAANPVLDNRPWAIT